jgi:uncharacterized membrane protein YkvA (DUF1232 family)
METLKKWADKLRSEIWILYRASTDPDTPWFAKVFILLVIAYALSPIDLIPDFVPVIGYLDDLILIPLGIYLGSKMIPPEVLNKYRKETERPAKETTKLGLVGAILILFSWLFLIALLIYWVRNLMETG